MGFGISAGDGGALIQLAPDLNFIADSNFATDSPAIKVTGLVDGTSGLVPALSLSGKFAFYGLTINSNLSEIYRIKLTIDGAVIWDSSKSLPASAAIFGQLAGGSAVGKMQTPIEVKTSLLLETSSATDTSYNFIYDARPIL